MEFSVYATGGIEVPDVNIGMKARVKVVVMDASKDEKDFEKTMDLAKAEAMRKLDEQDVCYEGEPIIWTIDDVTPIDN